MTRVFEDFGQQAVFEALVSRGAQKHEAQSAANKTPKWDSAEWESIEKHIEDAAKQVRVGLDERHTKLLRKREELESKITTIEDEIGEIEDRKLAELEAEAKI